MQSVRLRFESSGERPEIPLGIGMHHVARVGSRLDVVGDGPGSAVCFCVDRRGVWLTVGDGRSGVHVNGRQVRRLAMLRIGDSVYVDGHEIRLVGGRPPPAPGSQREDLGTAMPDPRIVLRGLGGRHHGRCFTLDVPRLVGRTPAADIRIDDPAFPERHARLEPAHGRLRLIDLDSGEGSVVNGEPVRDAFLCPGDQVVFAGHDRFVVEAPMREILQALPLSGDPDGEPGPDTEGMEGVARLRWGLPLVLLAALLIAGLLSLLLLYGAG